jgi:peptidoglycan/LPS O-acetylase OafA/YrhL
MAGVESGRLSFLDGLRGWAALTVLLYHTFVQVFYYSLDVAISLDNLLLFSGRTAVHAFFIISGFSLSASYVRTRDARSLARVGAGRYWRLAVPIFAACAIVHVLMVSGIIPPADQRLPPLNGLLRFEPSIPHLFKFSLFDVFFNFSFASAYIPPLWSIGPELAGSAIIIGLLALFGRWRQRLWVYGAAFIAFEALWIYCETVRFCSLFVAGLLIAELYHRWSPRKKLHQAALIGLFAFGWLAPFFESREMLFAYHASAISFCAAAFWLPWSKLFLENRVNRWLGRISFPLYLVHGPVIDSFSLWVLGIVEPLGFAAGETKTIVAFCTIPVAIGCATAFEPINRGAIWLSRSFGEAIVGGGMILRRQLIARLGAPVADCSQPELTSTRSNDVRRRIGVALPPAWAARQMPALQRQRESLRS